MKNHSVKDFTHVTARDFGLKRDGDFIQGERFKDKYASYQVEYQQKYGVLPEFDLLNRPFTAIVDDVYYYYRALEKRGFYGALWYHDVHGFINRKYQKFYNKYRKEWAFIFGFHASVIQEIEDRMSNSQGEHIENNLGYRVEDGIYYEGTWENGHLVYGLIYSHDIFYVGKIEHSASENQVLYSGIEVGIEHQKKEDRTEVGFGTFHMRNDAMIPYDGEFLSISSSTKDGISMTIVPYKNGYEHGKLYIKVMSGGEITVMVGIMKDGSIKHDISGNILFKALHLLMGLYMLYYYFLKYTVGLLIFAFYRIYRKKNWK